MIHETFEQQILVEKKNTKQNMILPFKAFEMMVLYEYNVEKYYLV